MTAPAFVGSGDLKINPKDAVGVPTGWVDAGNATAFTITPNFERIEVPSKQRGKRGQLLVDKVDPRPTDVSFTLNAPSAENLALIFQGQVEVFTQAATAVVDQPVTAILGRGVELGKIKISAVSVKDAATGLITYVAGTDYTVDTRLGILTALDGGAITDGQALEVSYTPTAITAVNVVGGTRPQINAALKFDGQNDVDGESFLVDVLDAGLTVEGEFDFLADGAVEFTVAGRIVTPPGQPSGYSIKKGAI